MKAVILAGGENRRFWPLGKSRHKCLYDVCNGLPILHYTLLSLKQIGITEAIIIKRPRDNFRVLEKIENFEILYVNQPDPKGMGDAILKAEPFLNTEYTNYFLVVNPNQINIDQIISFARSSCGSLERKDFEITLFGQETDNSQKYGIAELGEAARPNFYDLKGIEEKPQNPKSKIRIVGVYLLPVKFLSYLKRASGNYGFEEALDACVKREKCSRIFVLPKEMNLFSLKYPWELLAINKYLMDQHIASRSGNVCIRDKSCGVDPSARIIGNVVLGRNVTIHPFASIKGPCYIGDDSVIGDHAQVRDFSCIGKNVVIGAGSEIKNSLICNDVHTHTNFIGDSIVDQGSRFGIRTDTMNAKITRLREPATIKSLIDGKLVDTLLRSFGTVVGEKTVIGGHCRIMPGRKIGSNCEITDGERIKYDIPDDKSSR